MGKAITTGTGLLFLAFACLAPSGIAQEMNVGESSSSKQLVVEKKGYAFKYQQRLRDWSEQIDTGLSKGWLSPADGQKFKDRIANLTALEASVRAKGYPKADLDDMEKQFTQFNIDLSHASEPKPQAVVPGTTPQAEAQPPGAPRAQAAAGAHVQSQASGAAQATEKKPEN
jgi:hypothetical protein